MIVECEDRNRNWNGVRVENSWSGGVVVEKIVLEVDECLMEEGVFVNSTMLLC